MRFARRIPTYAALALKRVVDTAEVADLELLGPRLRIDTELLQQSFTVGRELAQGGAQHLAPLAEGRRRHPLQCSDVAGRKRTLLRHELDKRGVDLGTWREGGGRKGKQNARGGAPRAEHRETSIVLAARLGHDAERDLALEHENQPIEPRRPWLGLEPADEEGSGNAVGQVGDNARGRPQA